MLGVWGGRRRLALVVVASTIGQALAFGGCGPLSPDAFTLFVVLSGLGGGLPDALLYDEKSAMAAHCKSAITETMLESHIRAGVAELADAPGLGPGGATREGSSPFARTRLGLVIILITNPNLHCERTRTSSAKNLEKMSEIDDSARYNDT